MRRATLSILLLAACAGGLALARTVQPQPGAAAESGDALSPEAAREVASTLATALEENFVFPDVASRYAEALRSRAAAGAYDRLPGRAALAEALTRDVQAVAPEGHFRVLPGPPATSASPRSGGPAPALIEEARWLAPGIAYLRPTLFIGSAEEVAQVEAFLDEHEDAATLIVDMRVHRGGGLSEMDSIYSRLFAEPTRLVVMDTRAAVAARGGSPFSEGATLRSADSPAEFVRYEHWAIPARRQSALARARVFVLTSAVTASAGEHFALALKRTGRAVLIGATTRGAGHFGNFVPIGEGMTAFVPVGRTYDPDSGEGWEGVGVTPNVPVPAARALVEALVRSGIPADEAERLSASVAPTSPMERPAPAPRR